MGCSLPCNNQGVVSRNVDCCDRETMAIEREEKLERVGIEHLYRESGIEGQKDGVTKGEYKGMRSLIGPF